MKGLAESFGCEHQGSGGLSVSLSIDKAFSDRTNRCSLEAAKLLLRDNAKIAFRAALQGGQRSCSGGHEATVWRFVILDRRLVRRAQEEEKESKD